MLVIKPKNQQGFASIEFAYIMPVLALFFLIFFQFFRVFHLGAKGLISARHSAFATVGQVNTVLGLSEPGFIYAGECTMMGTCGSEDPQGELYQSELGHLKVLTEESPLTMNFNFKF